MSLSKQEESWPSLPSGSGSRSRSSQPWSGSNNATENGDEAFQKLSMINGNINRMSKEELQEKMLKMRLNACGSKDVLKKRLKNHYKKQRLGHTKKYSEELTKYPYLIVIDYEATCTETNEDFVHEIIEFPAVLIDTRDMTVSNVFQRFCKPKINPILTDFCSELTGISQDQVDKAKDFSEVLQEFEDWLLCNGLDNKHKFAILTDGPWDMARFLKTQTDISGLVFPSWAKQWINLRKAYSAFYGVGRVNLQHMLDDLGMTFEGRPHCGLDDAKNIANIAVRLLKDGCVMRINEYLYTSSGNSQKCVPKSPKSSMFGKGDTQGAHSLVKQEGEDISDLFELIKIQKS